MAFIDTATRSQLIQLYVAYFNRAPDADGLAYWSDKVANGGWTVATVARSFMDQTEVQSTYPNYMTSQEIVTKVYSNVLGRTADAAGNTYWVNQLNTGAVTKADLIQAVVNAANEKDATGAYKNATDAAILTNKTTVGEYFAVTLASNDKSAASSIMSGVTSDAATVTSAKASASANNGSTFTLTTGQDNVAGTANNDTINGFVYSDSASTSTFQIADVINGGAGTDTLNLTVSKTDGTATGAVTVPAASVSNVETINVRALSATAADVTTVSAANFVGATAVNADRAISAVTVTNLATGASAGMIGNSTVTNGALTFGYATATDAATLNITGGTKAGNVTISTTPASVTVNSNGAANTIGTVALGGAATGLTVNATTNLTTGTISGFKGAVTNNTVTVTGAATSVNIGTLDNTVGTVDASAMTAGGVTATLNTNTALVVKGGAGADSYTAGAVLGTGASVDAGAGTDTLTVTNATYLTATTGQYYKNFEVLNNGVGSALDVSTIAGITSLVSSADSAGFTKMNATQAGAITATISQASGTTYALADATGTSDVLSLTAKSATATTAVNLAALTVDGFETMNVTESSGSTTLGSGGSIAFTSAANLTKINLSGAYTSQLNISSGAAKVATVDASAATAGETITTGGQTQALTVTGSAQADAITAGTMGAGGSQTINAGAGNDTITGTQANIYAATINGGAGTDTLTISDNGLTVNDQTFKNVSAVEKLSLTGTGALTFTVGGYANSNIAGANSGVLDVTAANLTGGATVDASGLSGTNSLKLTATDTGAGNGNYAVTTSNGGADNITISGSTGTGTITVSGGNNTAGITVNTSGVTTTAAASSYTGGSGNDTFTVSGANTATITAGAGKDTITLSSADGKAQTIVENTANQSTTANYDVVNNFQMVAANGDLLKFAATTLLSGSNLGTGWTITTGVATKTGATVNDFISAFSTATTAGVVAFSDGTNMWVGYSDGTAGLTTSDQLVELVGITATAVSTTVAASTIGIV